MKLNNDYEYMSVCGEQVLMPCGSTNVDYNHLIHLNETASYLWQKLQGRDFSESDMADLLCQEYDVSHDAALADCQSLANKWLAKGLARC